MRFAVPVLSLSGLIFALVWAWLNGQIYLSNQELDASPVAAESMLYLLFGMIILQALVLVSYIRAGTGSLPKKTGEEQPPAVSGEEPVNTEWVLEALAGGVLVVTPKGLITYMNASAEKLLLWPREKVLGEDVNDILKLEDLQGNSLLERAFEAHRVHPGHPLQFGQVRLFPRVGEPRFVELHTTCILNDCKAIVFIFRDVTADRKIINRLYRQASRDALTDLMNRSSFEQYVEQLAHDTSSLLRTHVLASVDLDNFKTINDTCGHLAGDELLKQVAQIFRHSVRTSDKVARIGGDEFAVFLEGCGLDKGRNIMESVLTEIRNFRFSWEGKVFSIGASIGLLEFMPSSHLQIKQLFADVDRACYTAKALGRNQIFVHADENSGSDKESSQRVQDWSKLLKDAIREDRFMLFIQPIMPLSDTYQEGTRQYEVLLRLPFRQALLSPGSFLPMAGRLDMMAGIDRWIIRKALETLSTCCAVSSVTAPRLMINLSAHSVQDPEFFAYVEQQIKLANISPGGISFEISESVAISHFVHAKRLMNALDGLGCRLVLDDFGSGFSSLNYLRELPLSYLKIDGNFVHNLVTNPVDAAMVKAVHDVGQVMNLLTIAELVEDAQTMRQLREIGVDFAQGYYCGRPVPLAHLCEKRAGSVDSVIV